MDKKFQLTKEQENFIKEKMGVSDISNVKLIFEVNSIKTEGVREAYTNKSTKFSIVMCACPGGGFSWLCCE